MENNFDCLKVGTKMFYTGDIANAPGTGEIILVHSNDFYPILYNIELNEHEGEKRIFRNITPNALEKSPGRRFILKSEYEDERQKRIEELQQHQINMQ